MANFLMKNGPMFKIFLCGFLGLLLLIPTAMVGDLVRERSRLEESAKNEIASKWGTETVLSGPILSIPYSYVENVLESRDGQVPTVARTVERTRYLHVLPSELSYDTKLDPSVRSRGIYDVTVYRSEHSLKGTFDLGDLAGIFASRGKPDFARATVTVGFTDSRGIEKVGALTFGDKELSFTPGSGIKSVLPNGTTAEVDLSGMTGTVEFATSLSIRGSERIKFLPLGKTTKVSVSSPWPNPSFDGAFLPSERKIDAAGFSATWSVLDYNRDFPQFWVDGEYALSYVPTGVAYAGSDPWDNYGMMDRNMKMASVAQEPGTVQGNLGTSAFGVSLLAPVDSYDKTSRTVKYAILVIALTFMTFFLLEITRSRPIHPIQYLLVGFALVVFYVLTLSLSEYVGFDLAYLAAALMTVSLVTAYVGVSLRNASLTKTVAATFSLLYGFIFVILSSEDYALLLGSFGLFATIAALMYATRNVDWYALGEKKLEGVTK